jgi:hypothetical protein
MSDDQANYQQAVQEEVAKRQQTAIEEIANKYALGKGGIEDSVNAPTGQAYHQLDQKVAKEKKETAKARRMDAEANQEKENNDRKNHSEYDEEDGGDDDDAALRDLREQRVKEMRNARREQIEQVGKGHGQYRDIVQDDFITEVTSSDRVIVHFYHRDFERCKVMDHHLLKLSQRHLETKFVKIDAEKTPFFTAKLIIETLPTVCCFMDGVCRGKIIGYDGLTEGLAEDKLDEWPTIRLARWFADNHVIDGSKVVDDDGIEAAIKARIEAQKKSVFSGLRSDAVSTNPLDDDDDFDLDNIEDVDESLFKM